MADGFSTIGGKTTKWCLKAKAPVALQGAGAPLFTGAHRPPASGSDRLSFEMVGLPFLSSVGRPEAYADALAEALRRLVRRNRQTRGIKIASLGV